MEKSSAEVSNPLSTVDEIQRRLARPSSVSNHSRLSEKRVEKLEDYLDSNLLSAISARIGRKREKVGERKMREKEFAFDWPANELKALVEGGERRERDGAVDLTEDNDVINGVEEREEEIGCDLFGRFEETALKRLRG